MGCLANQRRLFPSWKWRETDSDISLLFDPKFFGNKNFFELRNFWTNIFWTRKFSEPKKNWRPRSIIKPTLLQKQINGFWHKSNLILSSYYFGMSGQRCSRSPSGGGLAMMFVDRYFHHYFFHLARAVAVRRSTENDITGHYFHHYFFFLHFFHSPLRPILIEGVLSSKKLI